MTAPRAKPRGRPPLRRAAGRSGGTGGIGLATATGLAGLGARVGIVGRSAARGAAAADAVRRLVPSAQVDVFEADLSAQAEVRRLGVRALDEAELASCGARYRALLGGEELRATA